MKLSQITLRKFKRVNEVKIELSPINLIVGGNNAGKSSVLEGIHFSTVAAATARIAGTKTVTQDALPYCPARHFADLRHGEPYKNQSNFGYLDVGAHDEENTLNCRIEIYRGRNEGNIGCEVIGYSSLRQIVTSIHKPFSVYVPGLSGISREEEYRTESIIRRGVASGDANLYLRNVLLLIQRKGQITELIKLARTIFPNILIQVSFDEKQDIYIDVNISVSGSLGKFVPIELTGTGVQQALQILSYIVLFRPYLLLLDEPDSHLHPDNQSLLANLMLTIASDTDTNVIASTHSRHLLDALYDESHLVWLKDGEVFQQGDNIGRIPLLMDIGALDSYDKLREGRVDWVILSEDSTLDALRYLLKTTTLNEDQYLIYSYKSSSNLQSALLLADFLSEIAPSSSIIIHRDRDFMTDKEVQWVKETIEEKGVTAFITDGSDIEDYFVEVNHLCALLEDQGINVSAKEMEDWLDDIATKYHNDLQHRFTRKRDDLKHLYRSGRGKPPKTRKLLGTNNPLESHKRVGKFMVRKIRHDSLEKFNFQLNPIELSSRLQADSLNHLLKV